MPVTPLPNRTFSFPRIRLSTCACPFVEWCPPSVGLSRVASARLCLSERCHRTSYSPSPGPQGFRDRPRPLIPVSIFPVGESCCIHYGPTLGTTRVPLPYRFDRLHGGNQRRQSRNYTGVSDDVGRCPVRSFDPADRGQAQAHRIRSSYSINSVVP